MFILSLVDSIQLVGQMETAMVMGMAMVMVGTETAMEMVVTEMVMVEMVEMVVTEMVEDHENFQIISCRKCITAG